MLHNSNVVNFMVIKYNNLYVFILVRTKVTMKVVSQIHASTKQHKHTRYVLYFNININV